MWTNVLPAWRWMSIAAAQTRFAPTTCSVADGPHSADPNVTMGLDILFVIGHWIRLF